MVDYVRDRYRRDYQTPPHRRTAAPRREPDPFLSFSEPSEPQVERPVIRHRRRAWRWRYLLLIVIPTLALAIAAGIFLFTRKHPVTPQRSTSAQLFAQHSQDVAFPLYYPDNLPLGYSIEPSSFSTRGGVFNFIVTAENAKKLIVTEQSLPPFTEEVKQTKKFEVSVGKAYIADLNGHNTGFIMTAKTMLIVNSADPLDPDQLQAFLTLFKSVN